MRGLLVMLFLLSGAVSYGQQAVFKWSDELCDYASTYDSRKYSKKQLSNCYKLCFGTAYFLSKTPAVFHPSDIDRLDVKALDQEYIQKSNELKQLDVPKTKFWNDLRLATLSDLDQFYKVSRTTYLAFKEPLFLRNWHYEDSLLRDYADALDADGDSLLATWHRLTVKMASSNCMPDVLWETYNDHRSSDSCMTYALIDVLMFGWWNHALEYIDRAEAKFSFDTRQKEFHKLFIKTKNLGCDEP